MTRGTHRELSRENLVLAAFASAGGRRHTPVQAQKLLFLLDREVPSLGTPFKFIPYHYGPFDPEVYDVLS